MNKEEIIIKKLEEAIKGKKEEKEKEKKKKGNFKQTLEMVVNFKNVDIEGKEKINLSVQLPKGRGKDIEVGVFADGDLNLKAKKISKHVLDRKELELYSKDKRKMRKFANSCYWFLAQADLMPLIGKTWGVVLGPRSKMPQPIPPNIDPQQIIQKFKNMIRIRSKKNPTIQAPIGTEDMPLESLAENYLAVMEGIEKTIPKEKIASVFVKKTMGEPVKVM